ncbi:MAG: hypothetical protein V8R91_21495 [Butyricimonas faecihominis]
MGTSNAITQFPIYSWQPTLADYDGYDSEINVTASSTTYAQFYSKILGCNAVLDYIDDAIGTPGRSRPGESRSTCSEGFNVFSTGKYLRGTL